MGILHKGSRLLSCPLVSITILLTLNKNNIKNWLAPDLLVVMYVHACLVKSSTCPTFLLSVRLNSHDDMVCLFISQL